MSTVATFRILLALFHLLRSWLGKGSRTPSEEVSPCRPREYSYNPVSPHLVHFEGPDADVWVSSVGTKIKQKFPSGEVFVCNIRVFILILPPRESFLQALLTLDIFPLRNQIIAFPGKVWKPLVANGCRVLLVANSQSNNPCSESACLHSESLWHIVDCGLCQFKINERSNKVSVSEWWTDGCARVAIADCYCL